jgi:hypothetical protein
MKSVIFNKRLRSGYYKHDVNQRKMSEKLDKNLQRK